MRSQALATKLVCFTFCLALSACVTAPDDLSVAEDRAAIDEIRARILEAELKGDASVFEQVATPDVVVMPPNVAPINGREPSVNLMKQFFSENQLHIEYANAQVQVNGDQAFDHGTYSQTVTPKNGGAPLAGKGQYWWFYARNADGIWQQKRVVWTTE